MPKKTCVVFVQYLVEAEEFSVQKLTVLLLVHHLDPCADPEGVQIVQSNPLLNINFHFHKKF